MGTTSTAIQTQVSIGVADGAANAHIRKQILRLRLARGWTRQDLEESAGLAPNTLGDLETGVRRVSVDVLQKIIDALECDISDVWPSPRSNADVEGPPPPKLACDPLTFSRLAEVHSLTGAEASCMFVGTSRPGLSLVGQSADEKPASEIRPLSSINLDERERDLLSRKLLQGKVMSPWIAYLHCENGRSVYLCLKNARVALWEEGFIDYCLSAWLPALQF